MISLQINLLKSLNLKVKQDLLGNIDSNLTWKR